MIQLWSAAQRLSDMKTELMVRVDNGEATAYSKIPALRFFLFR